MSAAGTVARKALSRIAKPSVLGRWHVCLGHDDVQ